MQIFLSALEFHGAYHLAKLIRKFRLKIKWTRQFPDMMFENFGPPQRCSSFSV